MKNKTRLIPLFILLTIFTASCMEAQHSSPHAVNGLIDIRGIDLTKIKGIPLNGEWSFYWKKLLTPAETFAGSGEIYMVPGSWQTTGNSTRPAEGYGTLTLEIIKDQTSGPLALKIPSISSSFRLWADDTLVCENGTVSESVQDSVPVWLPRVVILPESRGEKIRLTLQISNFHDRRDGFWGSIMLGTAYNINHSRDLTVAFELFVFGSLLIMSLYHFSLFSLRRKERSVLYFAFFCLLLALRSISGGECFLTYAAAIPSIAVYKMLFISFFLVIPAASMYFLYLYPDEVWRRVREASAVLAVLSLVLAFMPLSIITRAVIFFEVVVVTVFVYFIVCLAKALINRREGAAIFIAGWSILIITGINDILFDMGLIWTGLIAPFGLLFFIFSQAFLLSKRNAKAFRTIEVMSDRLISLDILKDEFLANTSHELKTPLNGIIGLAETLSDGARGDLHAGVKTDLSMIVTSGKRLLSLVNDILDFSKLKNRDMELHRSPVDIRSIIDSVIYISRPLLKKDNTVLVNRIGGDIPLIDADENRLQQVFYNIIGNAIKFTESGRIEIDAEITREGNSKMLMIRVSDTGIGIEKEKLESIFVPFQQGDGSISRKYGGTGIGLSISRQLVELHGGRITVESETGIGSVFSIILPFTGDRIQLQQAREKNTGMPFTADVIAGPVPRQHEQDLTPEIILNPEKDGGIKIREKLYRETSTVLIVDDDPVNIQVLENYLMLENYRIKKTRDGIEAINIIEKDSSIDIVLLDVMMPRITGYDVAKKIREKFTHFELPIIMLTAKNRIEDIVAGIESGANDYLPKPFDRKELMARVDNLLLLKKSVLESIKLSNIEHELEIARHIQLSTMSSVVPELDTVKIAVRYIPMERIGGDFYTFHVMPDSSIGILLTDVTGHGIPAALIASMLKIVSSILSEYAGLPDRFLREMNRMLTGNMGDHFLTALYIFIDSGKKMLFHANAGHEPIILFKRSTGSIMEDNPRGRIIGLTKDDDFGLSSTPLDSGDRIFLFTDCITEALNSDEKQFGIDSFKIAILETADMDAEECADFLLLELEKWTGRKIFHDDCSLIVIDIK